MRISRWLADYEPGDRCAGRAKILDRIDARANAPALRGTMTRSGVSDLDEDAAVSIEAGAAARRNEHAADAELTRDPSRVNRSRPAERHQQESAGSRPRSDRADVKLRQFAESH